MMRFYPERRYSCPYCGSKNITETEHPNNGKIVSYAVKNGNILALVELSNGCKLVGVLEESEPEKLKERGITGTRVKIYKDRIKDTIKFYYIDN